MTEEPGLGEIGRNVREIRGDMKALSTNVHAFQLDLTSLRHEVSENTKDIADIRSEMKAVSTQRMADRRLYFTAIIAPAVLVVFGIVVQVVLNSAGVL